MSGPYFVRADGYLTAYSHACGYLDSATANGDPMAVTMGREGCVYHVKARHPSAWETFRNRADAVKCFRHFIRQRGATRNPNNGRCRP